MTANLNTNDFVDARNCLNRVQIANNFFNDLLSAKFTTFGHFQGTFFGCI